MVLEKELRTTRRNHPRNDIPEHRSPFSQRTRGVRVSRSVDRESTTTDTGVDYTSSKHHSGYATALTRPLLQRRFSLSAATAGSRRPIATGDDTHHTDAERDSHTSLKSASQVQWSRKDVVYTTENMGFSRECPVIRRGHTMSTHRSYVSSVDTKQLRSRTGSVTRFVDINDDTEGHRRLVRQRASSVPRIDSSAIRSGHIVGTKPAVHRRASVSSTYCAGVDRSRPSYSCKNYSATAAIHTDDNDGFDIASFVLAPGEQFIPTNVSVSILPSGKKAITYTRFCQKGTGDQHKANVEIDRIIQHTNQLQVIF